jgi:uncharacterized membrane protein YsdA (DUF1294 family)
MDMDLFLTSILGGGIGAILLVGSVYFHLKHMHIKYSMSYEKVREGIAIKKLQDEISHIKLQIVALQNG